MAKRAEKLKVPLVAAGAIVFAAAAFSFWPGGSGLAPETCAAADVAPKGTTVVSYTPGCAERYAGLGKKTVLFFRAYWCGACADAAASIADAAASGPDDLVILEVDYDDSAALKRRYGVTLQHTFVQVGADGESLGKWVGFGTLPELYAALR